MKQITFALLVLSMLAMSCSTTSYLIDEDSDWRFLGSKKVNHWRERDEFEISNREKFTAIRLHAKERDIEISEVRITLINGDIIQPVVEKTIRNGERSRVIELAADGRQLAKVEIRYSSYGKIFSKKATVLLVGKQFDPNGKY